VKELDDEVDFKVWLPNNIGACTSHMHRVAIWMYLISCLLLWEVGGTESHTADMDMDMDMDMPSRLFVTRIMST
jgi:hypothetical protein